MHVILTSREYAIDPEPWAFSATSKSEPGPWGLPDRSAERYDRSMLWFARWEPNPLLTHMRNDLGTVTRKDRTEDYAPEDRNLRGVAERWAWYLENGEHDVSWEPAHLQHAARVIGKLLGREVVAKLA